ncbi:MAG: hypothetical protein IJ822_03035, partial [Pyramidobacter sp.]|nr:hypothetical protein [Pyramidobacter sp.]
MPAAYALPPGSQRSTKRVYDWQVWRSIVIKVDLKAGRVERHRPTMNASVTAESVSSSGGIESEKYGCSAASATPYSFC